MQAPLPVPIADARERCERAFESKRKVKDVKLVDFRELEQCEVAVLAIGFEDEAGRCNGNAQFIHERLM